MATLKTSRRPDKAIKPAQPKRHFARTSSPAPRQESLGPMSALRNKAKPFLQSNKSSTQSSPTEEITERGPENDNIFSRNLFSERDRVPPSRLNRAIAKEKS